MKDKSLVEMTAVGYSPQGIIGVGTGGGGGENWGHVLFTESGKFCAPFVLCLGHPCEAILSTLGMSVIDSFIGFID